MDPDNPHHYVWKRTYENMCTTDLERRIALIEGQLRTLSLRPREKGFQVSNDELRTALEALLKRDKEELAESMAFDPESFYSPDDDEYWLT